MKTKSNKPYNIALVLFVVVIISVILSPIRMLMLAMKSNDSYYRLGISWWNNPMLESKVFYDIDNKRWSYFFHFIFSSCLSLGPLIGGVIGSSKKKKLVSVISVLSLDVVCFIVVLSRFTGLGLGQNSLFYSWRNMYDGIKFSFDFLFQFGCIIALNVVVMMQKSVGVVSIESVNNTQPNSFFPNVNAIDEIKKLKSLLDMGILTKEEFEVKKKELL